MSQQKLELAAQEALDRILALPGIKRIDRCYEVARLLRDELIKEGYFGMVVKDGLVDYDVEFYLSNLIRGTGNAKLPSGVHAQALGKGKNDSLDVLLSRLKIQSHLNLRGVRKITEHSWCEFYGIVVDYHTIFEPIPNLILEDPLMVLEKDAVRHKVDYNPNGREFSILGLPFVYIPPWIRKLRI